MATYTTVDAVKLRINKQGDDQDQNLTAMILAAERVINEICNRPDGFIALASGSETAREFPGSGEPFQWLDEFIDTPTLVEVKDTASGSYSSWAGTDWQAFAGDPLRPDFNPGVKGRPFHGIMVTADGDYGIFTSGQYTYRRGFRPTHNRVGRFNTPTIRVTARWGFAETVPPMIEEATIILVSRWWKRSQSGWSDTLVTPDFGEIRYEKDLDPAVRTMLLKARMVKPSGFR